VTEVFQLNHGMAISLSRVEWQLHCNFDQKGKGGDPALAFDGGARESMSLVRGGTIMTAEAEYLVRICPRIASLREAFAPKSRLQNLQCWI
jgi:hypothetical protein